MFTPDGIYGMPVTLEQQWREMMARSFHPSQWFDGELVDGEEPYPTVVLEVRTMYVYRPLGDGTFTVGYYTPEGAWVQDRLYEDADHAASRVHWLNGGSDS